ncbi:hypothetical protein ACHAXR_007404 [Thalassiosira sp. AJA248-18]
MTTTGRFRKTSFDHTSNHSSNSNSNNGNHHHHNNRRRDRSNSHGHRKPQSKSDLWKGSLNKDIGNSIIVQMVGMESSNHTVYARVDPSCYTSSSSNNNTTTTTTPSEAHLSTVPIGKVIEIMVTEGWRHVAKDILEKGLHVETADSYPSAAELLQLGAVWLLNETLYAAGENAHARRLSPKDENLMPDWKDMTLRVYYVPDRFFVAHEVDWTKYCRGLLLDNCTSAVVGGEKAHVPVMGLPDGKDGVIVYEDNDIGYAVLNKPGGMPCHSTLSNHAEDVVSMFSAAQKERNCESKTTSSFLSLPIRVEPEMNGLILAATKKEFCSYMTKQFESAANNNDDGNNLTSGVTKTYRCLVCIKDPNDIDRIQSMVNHTIEHFVDAKSPTPKHFVRNKPKSSNHDWAQCLMRITSIGHESWRAACVRSTYSDSNDFTLAHRLWNPNMEHPAEDIGVQYVMQIDVQLLNSKARPHQIRGQLAALGIPIVGDAPYGGGECEMRMHRHLWTRMAVQICHLEFSLPKWEQVEGGEEKEDGASSSSSRVLVPSEEDKCVFHLNTAWWSEYLVDYEKYLVAEAAGSDE